MPITQLRYTAIWYTNTHNKTSDGRDKSSNPYMFIPNGFVIADTSKSSPSGWHESAQPFIENTRKILLEHIPVMIEEDEDNSETDIPAWFKTRARLWSQDRVSDSVYFAGIEHLIRAGIIQLQ